jgi:hypothetical protein
MFHPDIVAAYGYARVYAQRRPVDACTDVAEYYGIPVAAFARFMITLRISVRTEAEQLALLA